MANTPEMGVMFRREQDPATLVDYARRVEAVGFDQLWAVEDCFYAGGIAQVAIALAATSRLKVGMGINPAVARNPAFLAMEYATLANAFPGRFIGGIGHGVVLTEHSSKFGRSIGTALRSRRACGRAGGSGGSASRALTSTGGQEACVRVISGVVRDGG